jgi:hypothetical protein
VSFVAGSCHSSQKSTVALFGSKEGLEIFIRLGNKDASPTTRASPTSSFFDASVLSSIYTPMIVTPGNEKYKETHHDPFRTVMARADQALRASMSYLCIGYGFNDEHIQPIIIDENRNRNRAIVIVTKEVTPKMHELFLTDNACNCLIVSENTTGGTIVHYSKTETEIFAENYWQLDSFYKLWLE